ncbi:UDP-glucosyltransferase 2-like [Cydia pomonella]|uniref:UDP-glucosyltransferase 2-like n=1 Tax=Cydia pomonella TaxID=82600 RepID=UPI002ADDC382|nr:UDP-glucosyltransferase 2-like [Cydia pomonella]
MALKSLSAVLLLLCMSHAVLSANILALFSSLSFSDHLVFRGYVSLLAQKGHSIVLMTPYPGQFTYPDSERIVELDVGGESAVHWQEFRHLITSTDDYFSKLRQFNELSLKLAITQIKSKQMQALLINPNIKFDLVITEADVPFLYAVAEKYKALHISITTSSGKLHQHEAKGNPIHPMLYLDVNTLNNGNLSIWQKFSELYRHVKTKHEFYNYYLPLSHVAAEKVLDLKRDLQEVEYDIDLLLVAANPIVAGNRPTVPAVIYGDRMHIKPGHALPKNLQTLLDAATKGVVYFSLGAIEEAESLPKATLQTLADAFRELPFTVLWKIGNTTSFNKPENVIAESWFPQQEILAHPNVKAFITHGGPRSLEEAIYYKVPVVGFPTIRGRKVFIRQLTKFGAGEILAPYYLDKESVKATVSVVATDQKYKKAIADIKEVTEDPVISGPENAVWWTEYVLRHNGAKHLRSPAVGVSFIRYYMLDVIAFLLAVAALLLYLSFVMLKFTVRRLRLRFLARRELGGKFKSL